MPIKPLVKFASKSFTLPDTCVNLRVALDDTKKDLTDIAQLISVDPSLSAKILKLANSALFRFPSQIETVQKALNVIGGEAAYNISIAETANIAFKTFNSSIIDFAEYWQKAVMCGVIAKSIAQQKQSRGSERFFVLGILQGLSELIVASKHTEAYTKYQNDLEISAPLAKQIDLENLPQINNQAIETVGLSDEDYDMIINYSRLETSNIANLINS